MTVNPLYLQSQVYAQAFSLNSAATVNNTLVKTGMTRLQSLSLSNQNAAARFVKFYNKATAPVAGTDIPVMVIPVPATSFVSFDFSDIGAMFPLGLGIAITGAIADADTTAVTAGDTKVSLTFI